MKHFKKYIGLLIIPFCISLLSCSDDDDTVDDNSPDQTVIYSIKILNAGVYTPDSIVEGVVDEYTKEISFPRLSPLLDLSALKFEAVVSDRASLDASTYDFTVAEGEAQRKKIISVVNGKRAREYNVTIRLNIPVFGANFLKGTVYDYSSTSGSIYPDFTGTLTRGSAFDGEYVLIVSRFGGTRPHLLKVSDLKNKVIAPINLDVTNVIGGTFPIHSGALANGHVYIADLSGGLASPLKIYYWDTPASTPQVILNIDKNTIPGSGLRHGDNMSVNIDSNGNGYIYFGDNAATQILRFTVTNHTTVSQPTILPTFAGTKATAYMSYNRIENTSDYIFTGLYAPVALANESGTISYTMDVESTPERGSDARVLTFNKERYLIMCTAARTTGDNPPGLFVYNLTRGSSVKEAMELFDARADKAADYSYSLGGPINSSPATQTGYYIEKDDDGNDSKLYLYAASCDAGFTIFEFPIKTQED